MATIHHHAPPAGRSSKRTAIRLHGLIAAIGAFLIGLGMTGEPEIMLILGFAASWAVMAVGYDLFSGTSGRINMGYAMFPGVAAYTSAILETKAGWSPWAGAPAGVLAATVLAAMIGALTLRLQGKYFALTTSVIPLVFFQMVNIFDRLTGGEEGISGLRPFFLDAQTDLVFAVLLLSLCASFGLWFVRSKAGLVLTAIKDSELAARALGVDTFRCLFVGLLLSAALGGIGGVYLAHFQMYVGPDLLFIIATLQIVTFCQIGGPGTIVGPVLGSLALIFVNSLLRDMSDVRLLLYFVTLVLLLRFVPDGLLPALVRGFGRLGPLWHTLSRRREEPCR